MSFFKKINLSELQKKDTLENREIIKTEPCFNFYAVKVEKDIVTLLTGVKSNKDYKRQRHRRMGGIVTVRLDVDTRANERRCRTKRHNEEE